ncbi:MULTISPECIES: DUF6232 family protein [unclassified Sphingomonas]|uniref:DUF6232 family protein n=1 Tax=unclassified Sphingomonas TaxID=196159 RepID=UPI0006FD2849|nr:MULTISPECIES: DUF6232 family protein [unclassified Sphingomonas]KQX20695.1 hypothetical protein ASD17_07265 [Sphingomonas sp. Root1294]KQY68540.1 hypothetical protein ASD39_03785 [Sphingomonas sp. Root50]KRB87946.1 hypothetical protein ASE22_20960 [Sphingomonas sp. Root720]
MRYQNRDISIDDDFARFGSKSYAIDKINSVDVKAQPRSGCLWIILACIAALLLFAALGNLVGSGDKGSFGTTLAIAVAIGFVAWRASIHAAIVDYTLLLTTSSSEAQATQTTDGAEVEKMRAAIETAMVSKR